jgi:hypothetical protein
MLWWNGSGSVCLIRFPNLVAHNPQPPPARDRRGHSESSTESTLEKVALENGAQAYLIKQQTSADAIDKAIQKVETAVASGLGKKPKVCA